MEKSNTAALAVIFVLLTTICFILVSCGQDRNKTYDSSDDPFTLKLKMISEISFMNRKKTK